MATVVQDTKNTNSLAQTFNNTYGATPTEGNLLVAWIFHDENLDDVADLTSSGWTRMATVEATLSGLDYRISLWAKFAGSSESTTVAWDLGEANRRAHGYAVEFSDVQVTELNAEDAAVFVSGAETSVGTSNQVDDSIEIQAGQLGLAMVGLNGTSPTTPSWASEVTEHEDWSNNFRASAVGYVDPGATVQPTATWGSNRHSLQMVVALGVPPPVSKALKRSSFTVTKAA